MHFTYAEKQPFNLLNYIFVSIVNISQTPAYTMIAKLRQISENHTSLAKSLDTTAASKYYL